MISKGQLMKHLESIISLEESMMEQYSEYIEKLKDQKVLEKLKYIRDWEIKHIQLARKLIDIAKE